MLLGIKSSSGVQDKLNGMMAEDLVREFVSDQSLTEGVLTMFKTKWPEFGNHCRQFLDIVVDDEDWNLQAAKDCLASLLSVWCSFGGAMLSKTMEVLDACSDQLQEENGTLQLQESCWVELSQLKPVLSEFDLGGDCEAVTMLCSKGAYHGSPDSTTLANKIGAAAVFVTFPHWRVERVF